MFPCLVKYEAVFTADCHLAYGQTVYREWRLQDDFGNPGKLVKRTLLYCEVGGIRHCTNRPVIRGYPLSIRRETLDQGLFWEDDPAPD